MVWPGRGKVATLTLVELGKRNIPEFCPSALIQRNRPPVQSAEVHFTSADRDATISGGKENPPGLRIKLRDVFPYFAPRCAIDREHAIVRTDVIEDAVNGVWRGRAATCTVNHLADRKTMWYFEFRSCGDRTTSV